LLLGGELARLRAIKKMKIETKMETKKETKMETSLASTLKRRLKTSAAKAKSCRQSIGRTVKRQ